MTTKTDGTVQEQEAAWLREWRERNERSMAANGTPRIAPERRSPLKATPGPPRAGTQFDAVLEAARGLEQPFALSSLVVAAWGKDPALFGLPGFFNVFPSDRRVYVCLCGAKGLIARGLIRKLPGGLYEVRG